MGVVGPPPAFLAGEHGRKARGIDDPARAQPAGASIPPDLHFLHAAGCEADVRHRGRPQDFRAAIARAPQHLLVERGAVDLIGRQPRQIARADLRRLVQSRDAVVGKPETQSLFGEMVLVEVLREPEHAAEEVSAHLDGRLAHPAAEFFRFIHDQNADAGVFP